MAATIDEVAAALEAALDMLAELKNDTDALSARADQIFARDRITEHHPETSKDKQIMADSIDDSDGTAFQVAADSAFRAHGSVAPHRIFGESATDYRKRLLLPHMQHSPAWRAVTLPSLPASALSAVEQQVFQDSIAASRVNIGALREIKERDASGREISRFYGDPEFTWSPFKAETRVVTGWKGV